MSKTTTELLLKLSQPVPRYTSYPTAPEWVDLPVSAYEKALDQLKEQEDPLSLYFHIPFCKTMCLYCGCAVVLNRKEENEERYVDYIIKEIELVKDRIGKKNVAQVHFGGGTPTKLSLPLFSKLFSAIQKAFSIDFTKEVAIEIDPRTVYADQGEKLNFFKDLGFNRVSFGVQDTNEQVQEAVKRRQSYEMTKTTFELARKLGFKGINIDLIYGLPLQTQTTFSETVDKILEMGPDRIALFSYAKVPWLKKHQKAIQESDLPSLEEKFLIYSSARQAFIKNGYLGIGMDHFAKEEDEIAICYKERRLTRNFQGYSVYAAENMLGFGMTAIGFVSGVYVQNAKDLTSYYQALESDQLPIRKGRKLSREDVLRKWVIHKLMCDFGLDKKEFQKVFNEDFDQHFRKEHAALCELANEGLITVSSEKILVTSLGELFIRIIASKFDAYLEKNQPQNRFSNSI